MRFASRGRRACRTPLASTDFRASGSPATRTARRISISFYTVGTEPPVHPLPAGRGFQQGLGAILNFGVVWVRHVMAQDETFEPYDFYPPAYSERIQYISALFDSTNPDLSVLAGHDGKLMILHHSADNAVSTPMVAEYYRSVAETMGQAAADNVHTALHRSGRGAQRHGHRASGYAELARRLGRERHAAAGRDSNLRYRSSDT